MQKTKIVYYIPRFVLLSFAIATLVCVLGINVVRADTLSVIIELDKQIYFEVEDIWVTVGIVNETDRPLMIYEPVVGSRYLKLRLVDSSETAMQFTGLPQYLSDPSPSWILPARDTARSHANIVDQFGKYFRGAPWYGFVRYLPVGRYKMTAIYWVSREVEYTAGPVQFAIEYPEGIEKKAWELFKDADYHFGRGHRGQANHKLKELLEKFPSSVYAPRILKLLMVTDEDNCSTYAEKLIKNHPNSWRVSYAIGTLIRVEPKPEKKAQILRDLMRDYAGQKVGRIAEKTLYKLGLQDEGVD